MKKSAFHRALEFISLYPGCCPQMLALELWPKSKMHMQVSNQGHGAARGKAAWLCGGSMAGKLAKRGWVLSAPVGSRSSTRYIYALTSAGIRELERLDKEICTPKNSRSPRKNPCQCEIYESCPQCRAEEGIQL
jgi:hypothetical protein